MNDESKNVKARYLIKDVVERTGVTRLTVLNHISNGTLPAQKDSSGRWYVSPLVFQNIETYLSKRSGTWRKRLKSYDGYLATQTETGAVVSITDAKTNKTYLSVREFSKVTGFTILTVYQKVNGGKFPKEAIVEIGGRKFIDECFAKKKYSCSAGQGQNQLVNEIAKTAGLVPLSEVAERTGYSYIAVYKHVKDGIVPSVIVPGTNKRAVKEQDVEKYQSYVENHHRERLQTNRDVKNSRYLPVSRVARIAKIPVKTVREHIKQGYIEAKETDGVLMVDRGIAENYQAVLDSAIRRKRNDKYDEIIGDEKAFFEEINGVSIDSI